MLQHQQAISHADGKRSPTATLTDHNRDDWNRQASHKRKIHGYCLRLAALLVLQTGKGARGIDQANQWKLESSCHFHQTISFAISFRVGHAKIAKLLVPGSASFLMSEKQNCLLIKG